MSEKRPMIQINQEPPREMTEAEYAAFMERMQAEIPVPEKTAEERLAELEQAGLERDMALAELAELILGGGL